MLPASSEGNAAGCTPADNATVRPVFMIGPDKRVKLILTHPMTTGRNFNEIRLAAKHQVVTPANWRNGEGVILTAAVSDAETRFGGFTRVLPYLRTTPQPEG